MSTINNVFSDVITHESAMLVVEKQNRGGKLPCHDVPLRRDPNLTFRDPVSFNLAMDPGLLTSPADRRRPRRLGIQEPNRREQNRRGTSSNDRSQENPVVRLWPR